MGEGEHQNQLPFDYVEVNRSFGVYYFTPEETERMALMEERIAAMFDWAFENDE
jgi:hypothetical protein